MSSQAFGGKRPLKTHLLQITGGIGAELRHLWSAVDAAFSSIETRIQGTEAIADTTRTYHASIVTPSSFKAPGTKDPTLLDLGAILLLQFTPNADEAWRQYKIPSYYVSDAAIHLHWTKSSDANENGKYARWRITYLFFNGSSQDVNVVPQTAEVEVQYLDAGTTSRTVYRSANVPLMGAAAGYYLSLKVEAITPQGTPLASEPALFSADISFVERINR